MAVMFFDHRSYIQLLAWIVLGYSPTTGFQCALELNPTYDIYINTRIVYLVPPSHRSPRADYEDEVR